VCKDKSVTQRLPWDWHGIVSTMTSIYTGRSGVQILAEARELFPHQNIQTSTSAHPVSNSTETTVFLSGSKMSWARSLTTIICLETNLHISGAMPPLNLSPSMTHSGTTLFYLYLLPMYISLKRSHTFWPCKGTLLYITYPLHAHYMTHLFHLH